MIVTNGIGNSVAKQKLQHIQKMGDPVVVNGQSTVVGATTPLRATVDPISPSSAPQYLPEGSVNAANADLQMVEVAALALSGEPREQQAVTWDGDNYTILRVLRQRKQGVTSVYGLVCYRAPQPDSATADPTTGLRTDYAPPDQE
ncbi:hypothetical protein CCAX7_14550 [Capsulimonas corticalis]|uniref:Uncharacterized protein n=1 Tax=Capsulimonas corticalis TaxID=2219043 RepID=A0A402CZG1_9BACT|nr:hypothetical protein [Capsulimonas corticalis]BDI29404.1 hypothetical protein CCAX7_14550 [Capsulimonas corticalis]